MARKPAQKRNARQAAKKPLTPAQLRGEVTRLESVRDDMARQIADLRAELDVISKDRRAVIRDRDEAKDLNESLKVALNCERSRANNLAAERNALMDALTLATGRIRELKSQAEFGTRTFRVDPAKAHPPSAFAQNAELSGEGWVARGGGKVGR